ncbi:MAG: hypothetical protein QW332_06580 [Thermoproteota archaeon]
MVIGMEFVYKYLAEISNLAKEIDEMKYKFGNWHWNKIKDLDYPKSIALDEPKEVEYYKLTNYQFEKRTAKITAIEFGEFIYLHDINGNNIRLTPLDFAYTIGQLGSLYHVVLDTLIDKIAKMKVMKETIEELVKRYAQS